MFEHISLFRILLTSLKRKLDSLSARIQTSWELPNDTFFFFRSLEDESFPTFSSEAKLSSRKSVASQPFLPPVSKLYFLDIS